MFASSSTSSPASGDGDSLDAAGPAAPESAAAGSAAVRSAAVVNAEIRALWARAGGALPPAEQERYQRLLVEWAAAVRADVVEAA
ncbi:hypothetical protein ACFRKB_16040 [Streptomyces scopuliridis]|uniref:hypothetical protein n=1 Tax=Streptomyces scopuliridis TaxID=452529 RepID=UPI0036CEFCF9